MANLLLYFNEHPKLKLSNFLNETGHHLDEVEKTIRKLIDAKVLRSDPVG